MPYAKEALACLTNYQLTERFLGHIWRSMNAGGVSGKRSVRAWLLEDARDLFSFVATEAERSEETIEEMLSVSEGSRREDYPTEEDFLQEALRRPRNQPRLIFGADVSLSFVSDRYLAILLLRELRCWYKEDEKRNLFGFDFESRLLEGPLWLMGEPTVNPVFPGEELVREADARIREHYARSTAAF